MIRKDSMLIQQLIVWGHF